MTSKPPKIRIDYFRPPTREAEYGAAVRATYEGEEVLVKGDDELKCLAEATALLERKTRDDRMGSRDRE